MAFAIGLMGIAAITLLIAIVQGILNVIEFFKTPPPPSIQKSTRIIHSAWTYLDDAREKALYLESPTAFWLNPNRYGANGEYDLLAEPYVEKNVVQTPRQLGKWEYVKRPEPPKLQRIRM